MLLMYFLPFPRDHKHTVTHLSRAAAVSLCATGRGGGGVELHVGVDTMKWLIDYTSAGVIKIHRRGERHTMAGGATNCWSRPLRRYINCTFQSIVSRRRSSVGQNTPACIILDNDSYRRRVCVSMWIHVLCVCVCVRTGRCMLGEPCYAEIRPLCLSSDKSPTDTLIIY